VLEVDDAVDYILHAAQDFVDAATGKNPYFTCAVCGQPATDSAFTFIHTMEVVPYETQDGKPLCVSDFLAANPKYIEQHRRLNLLEVRKAEQIINARPAAAAPSRPTVPSLATAAPNPQPEE